MTAYGRVWQVPAIITTSDVNNRSAVRGGDYDRIIYWQIPTSFTVLWENLCSSILVARIRTNVLREIIVIGCTKQFRLESTEETGK